MPQAIWRPERSLPARREEAALCGAEQWVLDPVPAPRVLNAVGGPHPALPVEPQDARATRTCQQGLLLHDIRVRRLGSKSRVS